MRTKSILISLVFGALLSLAGHGPAGADSGSRHDGSVASVDATARRLVLRELVANARPIELAVRIAPDARIVVSTRNEHALDFSHEFSERSISLSEIHPGDFVVVELTGTGAQARAESVIVTLPGGA
jgi:hypothetical protein